LNRLADIPLDLQPKLLRALQEKAFERLGGTKAISIDVRLIAATNCDLPQMIAERRFRSDLYYRLRVFPITTPALRDRFGDIPALVEYFIHKYARETGKSIEHIPKETMKALLRWPWPGNVRELENFIQPAVILSMDSSLQAPLDELSVEDVHAPGTLRELEHNHILRTLREENGVVTATAARQSTSLPSDHG